MSRPREATECSQLTRNLLICVTSKIKITPYHSATTSKCKKRSSSASRAITKRPFQKSVRRYTLTVRISTLALPVVSSTSPHINKVASSSWTCRSSSAAILRRTHSNFTSEVALATSSKLPRMYQKLLSSTKSQVVSVSQLTRREVIPLRLARFWVRTALETSTLSDAVWSRLITAQKQPTDFWITVARCSHLNSRRTLRWHFWRIRSLNTSPLSTLVWRSQSHLSLTRCKPLGFH